jgi:hypothetical protein
VRSEIGQGAPIEIAGCVEAPHGPAVSPSNAIKLIVHAFDVNRVALVPTLRQTIHDGDGVAFGPAVGQRARDPNDSQHDSGSKSLFGIANGGEQRINERPDHDVGFNRIMLR